MKILLKDILETFPFFINQSTFPLDLGLNSLFEEVKKKLIFFYDSTFINNLVYDSFPMDNMSYTSRSIDEHIKFGNTQYLGIKSNLKNSSYKFIKIKAPIKYIFEKLRLLGFIHPYKKRPISNSQYLAFNDVFILKSFGYLANSLLLWFRLWFAMFFITFI
jgi:hypothetical protein